MTCNKYCFLNCYIHEFGEGEQVQQKIVDTSVKESSYVEQYNGKREYKLEIYVQGLEPNRTKGEQVPF